MSQASSEKQTGAEMEAIAGRVLQSPKYSEKTKRIAASVTAQANKERKAKGK